MKNIIFGPKDLFPVVSRLAERYTGGEHSSVTYETAQMLMEAVLYCINESRNDSGYAVVGSDLCAQEVYEAGYRLVLQKVKLLKEMYQKQAADFEDYGLKCLGETFYAIPDFFVHYDARFAPQEMVFPMEYPVFRDLSALSGIDAVLEYVRCIVYEQRFLAKLDSGYVRRVLRAYLDPYEDMMENICEIVLLDLLRRLIFQKPLSSEATDRDWQMAPEEERTAYIERCIQNLTEHYFDGDMQLNSYFQCRIGDLAIRIQTTEGFSCVY